jgi:hypothetical protein
VTGQSYQKARCSLGQFLPVKSVADALAGDRTCIDDNQFVRESPVFRLATGALIILDDMLVCDFQVEDIVPEPKHAPENGVIQEAEISRPIDVVDQLFGGDQQEVLFAKVCSSERAAFRQLLPRQFKTLRLGQYRGSPGMEALYGNEFLVVPVHPCRPKSTATQRRKGSSVPANPARGAFTVSRRQQCWKKPLSTG